MNTATHEADRRSDLGGLQGKNLTFRIGWKNTVLKSEGARNHRHDRHYPSSEDPRFVKCLSIFAGR